MTTCPTSASTNNRPWILHQTWSKLLFAHWALPPAALRPLIPAALDIDTFDGQAWVGVVPFYMSGIRFRALPTLPSAGEFCELNVRTYVTMNNQPGVWFFSLDASSALAVFGARQAFHLPYYNANMTLQAQEQTTTYNCHRTHRGAAQAEFSATYHPVSPVFQSQPDSLEFWLTERYHLYSADRRGGIYRGDIEHPRWPLQTAQADIRMNTMALAGGLTLPDTPPLLHYAERMQVKTWYLQKVH
jgi:uncharacterized protein YqjF (DUF2071 family)